MVTPPIATPTPPITPTVEAKQETPPVSPIVVQQTPVKTPEEVQNEKYKAYRDEKALKKQEQEINRLNSVVSLYNSGDSLYTAVK